MEYQWRWHQIEILDFLLSSRRVCKRCWEPSSSSVLPFILRLTDSQRAQSRLYKLCFQPVFCSSKVAGMYINPWWNLLTITVLLTNLKSPATAPKTCCVYLLSLLCVQLCLILCVINLSSFSIFHPSISKEWGFLGEFEVEHRDYANFKIRWII